jgi:signal transduction histidine kinase
MLKAECRQCEKGESVGAERRESELLLTVADTGIGAPLCDRTRVIEELERGKRQSGAGLGLSLVKSLIGLHGGTVAIESATGRGTTIVCRLPTARRHPTRPDVRTPSSEPVETQEAA